ncbi:MAG: nucleotidyltransferase family protein [Gemmatimonadota bacterium]
MSQESGGSTATGVSAADGGALGVGRPAELSPAEVEARFRWARARGHPDYLWPEVPPGEWRAAAEELAGVVAAELGDPSAEADPAGVVGDAEESGDVEEAGVGPVSRLPDASPVRVRARGIAGYTSGVGPLLGYWIERGRIEAGPATAALLLRHLDHSRRRAERLEGELARVVGVLRAADIRPAVIKGTHTARDYFPDAGTRPGADIDVVVPSAAMPDAQAALAAAGYELRVWREYSGRSDWWPPGVRRTPISLEMVHADDPYSIDLQNTFARFFGGPTPIDAVGGAGEHLCPWPWLDGEADVVAQPALIAHLALHASERFRNLSLIRLVELVIVIRRAIATGELHWDALHDLLDRTGTLPYVYPAFALTEKLAPRTVDADFLAAARRAAAPRPARAVDAMRPGRAQVLDRISVEEYFFWARGPLGHLRRAWRIIWPKSVRGSVRDLARLYVRRAYRLLRRRLRVRHGPIGGS